MLQPKFDQVLGARYHMGGYMGGYLTAIGDQWLKVAPSANPAMLEMIRDRDELPIRQMEPWAGEFIGKYLTAASQVLRVTGDQELQDYVKCIVAELLPLQDNDGYLGPWTKDCRLTGHAPNAGAGVTWDAWGHYHAMLGLMLWYENTGDEAAFNGVKRIADLLCNRFLGADERLVDTGCSEMNLAPVHTLCLLYKKTRTQRYLDLALEITKEYAATDADGNALAGDYLNAALARKEFFETPRPRWESLHPVMGLVELYYITEEPQYRQAFEQLWWSIVKLDRHNNGGFSSGEQAQGNPYHLGAIETCCTIAWMAMTVEMLRLTGNSIVADELELSTINSVVGLHSHTGRWATYNTPMDGIRKASAHEIVFQSREGSPELNCCSVNSARGFGLLSDWALMRDREGLILNWYGEGTMETELSQGGTVTIVQETNYPVGGTINLCITPSQESTFTLKLRIPVWSAYTRVTVNQVTTENITPGSYLSLPRQWAPGDTIEVTFDMSVHFWKGERECEGKTSIYRGPVLLTYDRRFNSWAPEEMPILDAVQLVPRVVNWEGWIPPILLVEVMSIDGQRVQLCDFGSAGEGGTHYRSWLPVQNAVGAEFSPINPLRSVRLP